MADGNPIATALPPEHQAKLQGTIWQKAVWVECTSGTLWLGEKSEPSQYLLINKQAQCAIANLAKGWVGGNPQSFSSADVVAKLLRDPELVRTDLECDHDTGHGLLYTELAVDYSNILYIPQEQLVKVVPVPEWRPLNQVSDPVSVPFESQEPILFDWPDSICFHLPELLPKLHNVYLSHDGRTPAKMIAVQRTTGDVALVGFDANSGKWWISKIFSVDPGKITENLVVKFDGDSYAVVNQLGDDSHVIGSQRAVGRHEVTEVLEPPVASSAPPTWAIAGAVAVVLFAALGLLYTQPWKKTLG